MNVGISLFLMAIGAVLMFAVNVPATGIDVEAIGLILMAVGFGMFLYSMLLWGEFMPWRRERTVIRDHHLRPVSDEPDDSDRIVTRERRLIEHQRRAS